MSESQSNVTWENIFNAAPYNRELGLKLGPVVDEWCELELPYRECLVGNPETGVLHGGVITALIDVAFGVAIQHLLPEYRPRATLDLRIDYLKPATPGKTVYAAATCYKLTAQLAFVRGVAYHETRHNPISTGVGIYMFTDGANPATSEESRNETF
ncbi:MAG: PaaI family thioesterase [Geobacteraceae bacterium]